MLIVAYCINTWWMFFKAPRSTRHSVVVSPTSDTAHSPVYCPSTARSAVKDTPGIDSRVKLCHAG